uniref:transglutaminase-like domain-containing protein n=1 Tax=Litorivivens sp. TaxID=2020868 RepID=UPI00356730EC
MRVITIVLLLAANQLHATDIWQSVTLGGKKIGHRHIQQSINGFTITTTETLFITLQQPGEQPRTSTTTQIYRETLTGKPLAYSKQVASNAANYHYQGLLKDDRWLVTREQGGDSEAREFRAPDNFLLNNGVIQALSRLQNDYRTVNYSSFSFATMAFEPVELRARKRSGEHSAWHLERKRHNGDITHQYANESFQPLKETAESGGELLELVTCSQACAEAAFQPATHVYRQIVRSPFRLPEAALRGHIRYTLRGNGLNPPQTGEQQVIKKNESGEWQLDICASCGSEQPPTAEDLARLRQSSYWITAEASEIRATLNDVLPSEQRIDVVQSMSVLKRFVQLAMDQQPDYAGFGTALEALQTGKGDCTEHALLLAALARAAGFPARVALGMAYSNQRFLGRSHVFTPHAWVQVWTGDR